jgi:hypothetical protein
MGLQVVKRILISMVCLTDIAEIIMDAARAHISKYGVDEDADVKKPGERSGVNGAEIRFLDFNYKKEFSFDEVMKLHHDPQDVEDMPKPSGRVLGVDGKDLGLSLGDNYDRVLRMAREDWSLEEYEVPRMSIPVYSLKEQDKIGKKPMVLVHEFVVKRPGSDEMWVPKSFGDETSSIHMLIRKAHAAAQKVLGEERYTNEYYSYLEIRQKFVRAGERFRSVGATLPAHFDGWNGGERDALLPEIGFHLSSKEGTLLFPEKGFKFKDQLNPLGEWGQCSDYAKEAIDKGSYVIEPTQTLIMMDSYALHTEPIEFKHDTLRTFIRIQFTTACWGSAEFGDLHNNSVNPKHAQFIREDAQCQNELYKKRLIARTRMFDGFSLEVRNLMAEFLTLEEMTELMGHIYNKDVEAMARFVDKVLALNAQGVQPIM